MPNTLRPRDMRLRCRLPCGPSRTCRTTSEEDDQSSEQRICSIVSGSVVLMRPSILVLAALQVLLVPLVLHHLHYLVVLAVLLVLLVLEFLHHLSVL